MKTCPACKTQYTDDTLQFCLQDGTPLAFASQADTPTAALNDAETLAARKAARLQIPIDDPNEAVRQPSEMTRFAPATAPPSGSRTALIGVLAAIAVLAVLGLAGLGAWTILLNSQSAAVNI